ncbi:hypothetical protein FGB62_167g011 [Gracilaria domingensis]|nr:hypothetical protein FGB62_167g011 [Gracilaria domingensis]
MDNTSRFSRKSARTKKPLVVSHLGTYVHPGAELNASEVEEDERNVRSVKSGEVPEHSNDRIEEGVQIITEQGEQQTFTIDTSSSSGTKSVCGNGENEQNVLHIVNSPLRPPHSDRREDVQHRETPGISSDESTVKDRKDDTGQKEDSKVIKFGGLIPFRSEKSEIVRDDQLKQDPAGIQSCLEVVDLTKTEEEGEESNLRSRDGFSLSSTKERKHLQREIRVNAEDRDPPNEDEETCTEHLNIFEYPREMVLGLLKRENEEKPNDESGPKTEAEESGDCVVANGKRGRTEKSDANSNVAPKRRRLNCSETPCADGKQLKFEDIGRMVLEGVMEKRSQKRILTILFEDNSQADLVLESEEFYVFGTAVFRIIRRGMLSGGSMAYEYISCTRDSTNPINEDASMKVRGCERIAAVVEKDDCVFVCCRSTNRYLAGRVILIEKGECFFVKVFREDRRKWVAPRAIREFCMEVIELD